jgi:hypothetical protein
MKLFVMLFFLGFVPLVNAQDKVLSIPNNLHDGYRFVDFSFVITDDVGGTFSVFIKNNKDITARMYDEDYNLIGEFVTEAFQNKNIRELEYTVHNHEITFYFSKKEKEIGTILFNFDKNEATENQFNSKLKDDEEVFHSYTEGDTFYKLTINKKSSVINIHVIHHNGSYNKRSFDFSDKTLKNSKREDASVYDILTEVEILTKYIEVTTIDDNNPITLDLVKSANKLYRTDAGFTLTLDQSNLATYLFNYNKANNSLTLDMVLKKKLRVDVGENALKTNSFLLNNYLFQISVARDQMIANVSTIDNKQEVKRWELTPLDETIPFVNTSIIIEGASYNPKRIRKVEKATKFLRKVYHSNVGILAKKIEDNFQVIFGASDGIPAGASMSVPTFNMQDSASPGGMVTPPTFHTLYYNYNSYKHGISTRVEGYYDNSFENIEGEIPKSVYQKISTFEDTLKASKAKMIFKLNSTHYFGHYNIREKEYQIFSFSIAE